MNCTRFLLIVICFSLTSLLLGQDTYENRDYQFLSFQKIPTWVGVASNWDKPDAKVHLYDPVKYKGHAAYISKGLKTGITFKQFKEQVRNYDNRKYMPFFLFDLRESNVIIDDIKYSWALRIEDYRFEDSPNQMAETTQRLMKTIEHYIGKQSGKYSKGIIVLASYQKATPNTSIAKMMNKKGYPNRTRSELLALAGGKKVHVLNTGIAMGYLRYIKAGEEDKIRHSPHDILIYESLPDRVPPVSGIITLEPQTPLSHINLLAKNRQTINLYTTKLSYLPHIESLIGKLVKIDCKEQKISIYEVNEKEAKTFWESRTFKVEIPEPNLKATQIIDLANYSENTLKTSVVGAKASNYGFIQKHYPTYTRPGFAIPFSFYFNTIKKCKADTLINLLVNDDPSVELFGRKFVLALIRQRIKQAELDSNLINDVSELIKNNYPDSRIRLRSSTNCEDLPQFNGAGLYLSKGFNVGDSRSKLSKKILQVYASLWTETAFDEREFYAIEHAKVGMAILINEAFSEEHANGVVLTIPTTNDYSIFINTQYGDELVTNPKNGQIPESILYPKHESKKYEVQSESNIQAIFLTGELKQQLQELKELSCRIHQELPKKVEGSNRVKYGVDIEFKILKEQDSYKLYIKQARLLGSVLPE